MCGGTFMCRTVWILSAWSIPACAGEPYIAGGIWWQAQVYPRVCGGTYRDTLDMGQVTGLSPRVRGNRSHAVDR